MAKKARKLRNIVGPQIRRLRYEKGLTQALFAARCTVVGFELSRASLSKIEAQVRCVSDEEVLWFADALRVDVAAIFPSRRRRR